MITLHMSISIIEVSAKPYNFFRAILFEHRINGNQKKEANFLIKPIQ